MSTPVVNRPTAPPAPLPPRVAGLPLVGPLLEARRDVLGLLRGSQRRYGDMFRLRLGPREMLVMAHPDHVQRVFHDNRHNYVRSSVYQTLAPLIGAGLLISEGDVWRRQRRLMQPAFTPASVAGYADPMVETAGGVLDRWDARPNADEPLEIGQAMVAITMAVLGRTVFGADFLNLAPDSADTLTAALRAIDDRSRSFVDLPTWVPTPANRRLRAATLLLDAFIDRVIADRERAIERGEAGADLLARLLTARDEVMTLFLAGQDTTASTLTWALALLAQHPEVERRLHDEVDAVLGDRPPTLDDVPRLGHARRICDEALRLYSPAWLTVRHAVADDAVSGYRVPAGAFVTVAACLVHRHPSFWEDPDRFEPDRFTDDAMRTRHRFAYFPFATGSHTCIGVHFANQEAVLVLATIARRYRLELVPGQSLRPTIELIIRPPTGLRMVARRR